MGAVNYGTSSFFHTLGFNIDNIDPTEEEIEDCMKANNIPRETAIEALYESTYDKIEDLYLIAIDDIENYTFESYEVYCKEGYYDGFYICIDTLTYDIEELDAELPKLKELLLKLVDDCGVVVCFPHWCTNYLSIEETKKAINNIKINKNNEDNKC